MRVSLEYASNAFGPSQHLVGESNRSPACEISAEIGLPDTGLGADRKEAKRRGSAIRWIRGGAGEFVQHESQAHAVVAYDDYYESIRRAQLTQERACGGGTRWSIYCTPHRQVCIRRDPQQRRDTEKDKYEIARQPCPLDEAGCRRSQVFMSAGVPISVLQNVVQLHDAAGKQVESDHRGEPEIKAPE